MSDRNFIFTLSKVIIAAAWADGEIHHDERNSLKDLLFRLPQIGLDKGLQLTGQEWQRLEMYMHAPIDDAERQRLIEDLQVAMRTSQHKKLVVEALGQMAHADGEVTAEETAVINHIKRAINNVDTSVFSQMGKLVGFAMQRRSATAAKAPNRERFFNDFVKNKVFYSVARRLRIDQKSLNIPEDQLRLLSLAGGLMAMVAHIDEGVVEEEFDAIVRAMEMHWGVGKETAVFVAEIAVSEAAGELDHHRTVRQFATQITPAERLRFLDVLFAVADADGHVSYDEIEEIRAISRSMHVHSTEFIQAKLKIPRERRDT